MSDQPPYFIGGENYLNSAGQPVDAVSAAFESGLLSLDDAARLLANEYRTRYEFTGDYRITPVQDMWAVESSGGMFNINPGGVSIDDKFAFEVSKIILRNVDERLHAANIIQGMDFLPLFEYVLDNSQSFGLNREQKRVLIEMLGAGASQQMAQTKANVYYSVVGGTPESPQYAFQKYPVEVLDRTAYRVITSHYASSENQMFPKTIVYDPARIHINDEMPGLLDVEAQEYADNYDVQSFDYMSQDNLAKMPPPLRQFLTKPAQTETAATGSTAGRVLGYRDGSGENLGMRLNPTGVRPYEEVDDVFVSVATPPRNPDDPFPSPAGRSRGFNPARQIAPQQQGTPPTTTTPTSTTIGVNPAGAGTSGGAPTTPRTPVAADTYSYNQVVNFFRIDPDNTDVYSQIMDWVNGGQTPEEQEDRYKWVEQYMPIVVDDVSWVQDLGIAQDAEFNLFQLINLPYQLNPGGLRVLHNVLAIGGYYQGRVPDSLTNPGDATMLNAWNRYVSDAIRNATDPDDFDSFLNSRVQSNFALMQQDINEQEGLSGRYAANQFAQNLLGRDLSDAEYNTVRAALQNLGQEQFAAAQLGETQFAPFISTIQETVEGIAPGQQEAYADAVYSNNVLARLNGLTSSEDRRYVEQFESSDVAMGLTQGS